MKRLFQLLAAVVLLAGLSMLRPAEAQTIDEILSRGTISGWSGPPLSRG